MPPYGAHSNTRDRKAMRRLQSMGKLTEKLEVLGPSRFKTAYNFPEYRTPSNAFEFRGEADFKKIRRSLGFCKTAFSLSATQ